MSVRLIVFGRYACFTRPETKVERVSYEVMTPSAARGILEAIHWKPAIRWVVEEISVLSPIRYQTLRRNEVGTKIPARAALIARNSFDISKLNMKIEEHRQQRASSVLVDVRYAIKARFHLTDLASLSETEGKHLDMFNRRARRGQCFSQPYFGTREFPAYFRLIDGNDTEELPIPESRKLGIMLYDIDHVSKSPIFFRAQLDQGVMKVPPIDSENVFR